MALYRANNLEFAGVNNQAPIANLQTRQRGVALDYNHLDDFGKPKVVYSWNRNIHAEDFGTKGNTVAPVYQESVSSTDSLRISAAQHMTKAYKDGMEYIRAEEDYRKKQKYIDSITPGRSANVTLGNNSGVNETSGMRDYLNGITPNFAGTPSSKSGMPIPDQRGYTYNYSAETTAMTGLMFQAPSGGTEASNEPSNGSSRSGDRIIVTKETEIRQDPETGLSSLYYGSGSTTPLDPAVKLETDIPIPGLFPTSQRDDDVIERDNVQEEIRVPFSHLPTPPPFVVANSRDDPGKVADILEANSFNTSQSSMPAKTPFRAVRDRGIRRAPIINKRQPPARSDKRVAVLEQPLLSDPVIPTDPQFYPSEPGVQRTDLHGRSSRFQPYSKSVISQRPKVDIPPQLPPYVNLRRGRDLEDDEDESARPLRRQRIDEGIQYLQPGRSLRNVERDISQRRAQRVTRDINYDPSLLPPPQVELTNADFATSSGLELRPLAALRGRRVADYVLPTSTPIFGDEPTVNLRRPRDEEFSGRPRKRARRI
ncbi:hypothetical protein DFS34DRAFT_671750 [Phlyctochytrium arcticum]|nr:hypothetical protein DFS34DRAFT_671750 [Phlyctochytrium arcticum]